MVLIHVKGKSPEQEFLFEAPASTPCDQLTTEICDIHNGRLRVERTARCCEELFNHGPAKHPKEHSLDEYMEEGKFKKVNLDGEECKVPVSFQTGEVYRPCPLGKRTGCAPNHDMSQVISKTCLDALNVISKNNVAMKRPLTKKMIEEALDTIRGAIMIVYPMGLPEWDEVRLNLEHDEDPSGGAASLDIIDANSGVLWWAGKQFAREKLLSDYCGKNEKTKIVAKLQKKGQGAPSREPTVDAQTQKEMLAFYHKKQEAMKQLAENDDDAYLNSSWANPKALKASLQGGGDVRWKGGIM